MAGRRDLYDDGDYKRSVLQYKKTNHLLVNKPMGKVKPSTYNLPPDHWTFGKKDQYDDEGVREVVGSWKEHVANPECEPGRDFVRLNKSAVVSGCVTAKNVATFRARNDIRLKQGPMASHSIRGAFPPDDTTFGRPTRPSTPLSTLIANVYQRNWIENQRSLDKARQRSTTGTRQRQSQHTRASLGHQKVRAPPPGEPFKMERFKHVSSRVRYPRGNFSSTLPAPQQQPEALISDGPRHSATAGGSAYYSAPSPYQPASYHQHYENPQPQPHHYSQPSYQQQPAYWPEGAQQQHSGHPADPYAYPQPVPV